MYPNYKKSERQVQHKNVGDFLLQLLFPAIVVICRSPYELRYHQLI